MVLSDLSPLTNLARSQLLLTACQSHPSVYASVLAALEAQLIDDGRTDISFDAISKDAWKDLNPLGYSAGPPKLSAKPAGLRKKFTLKDDPKQPPAGASDDNLSPAALASLAASTQVALRTHLEAITSKTNAYSAWETRLSAVSTLRKIGKSLALSDSAVASHVRSGSFPLEVIGALSAVSGTMTEEERREWVEDELREEMAELVGHWDKAGMAGGRELRELVKGFDTDGEDDIEAGRVEDAVRAPETVGERRGSGTGASKAEVIELDSSDDDEVRPIDTPNKKLRMG